MNVFGPINLGICLPIIIDESDEVKEEEKEMGKRLCRFEKKKKKGKKDLMMKWGLEKIMKSLQKF